MAEIKIVKHDSASKHQNVYVDDFSIDIMHYAAGEKVVISHKNGTNDESEVTSHYIASGKVRYVCEGKDEVLSAGDAIAITNLTVDDCHVEVLEDAVIVVIDTNYAEKAIKTLKDVIIKIDEKDHYTAKHCRKVCEYATAMAKKYDPNLSIDSISRAACILDAGMIFVPERIIAKGEELNEDDVEIIAKHPLSGGQMISQIYDDEVMINAVSQHHERLDGSGYPQKLKGDEITTEARILMIADMFDALTSDRGYRKAFSVEKAMDIIEKDAKAGRLDANIVEAFKKCWQDGDVTID